MRQNPYIDLRLATGWFMKVLRNDGLNIQFMLHLPNILLMLASLLATEFYNWGTIKPHISNSAAGIIRVILC